MTNVVFQAVIFSALLFIPLVLSHGSVTQDNVPCSCTCATDKSQSNNVTPPPQKQNNGTPPPQKQNNVTPPPQKQNNVTPPPQKQNNVTPPPQKQNSVTPPPQKQNSVTPPQKQNSVTQDNVSHDNVPCPSDKSQLNSWFDMNVQSFESRKGSLDSALEAAEANPRVIKVNCDGSGDFKTINDAIKSIPNGNTNRVIISLGPGNYTENIKIESTKPFITLYGDANNKPTIACGGTASQYGAADSATLNVESDYFSAVNVIVANSAPRSDVKRKGAQSVALRIAGDKASFFNCNFHGSGDTLHDVKGNHVFKDCYIEGTGDYMFGLGKSLHLNGETHIIPGNQMAMNPPRARQSESLGAGYSFVHCKVTGTGNNAYLGRAWMNLAKVVYAYSEMHDVFQQPQSWFKGWLDMLHPNMPAPSSFFGQFGCTGAGSNVDAVAGLMTQLSGDEAKPFMTLGFVGASKWLLPPIHI